MHSNLESARINYKLELINRHSIVDKVVKTSETDRTTSGLQTREQTEEQN